jgi:hypothetical protein
VLLAVVILSISVVWALLSVIVVLEGYEDDRTITLAGNQLAAELAGALGLLISGAGVVGAAWIVRSFGHPRFANRFAKPS